MGNIKLNDLKMQDTQIYLRISNHIYIAINIATLFQLRS